MGSHLRAAPSNGVSFPFGGRPLRLSRSMIEAADPAGVEYLRSGKRPDPKSDSGKVGARTPFSAVSETVQTLPSRRSLLLCSAAVGCSLSDRCRSLVRVPELMIVAADPEGVRYHWSGPRPDMRSLRTLSHPERVKYPQYQAEPAILSESDFLVKPGSNESPRVWEMQFDLRSQLNERYKYARDRVIGRIEVVLQRAPRPN